MIKTKQIPSVKTITEDVFCNICGKSCVVFPYTITTNTNFEYATVMFDGGYGAGELDMVREEMHICLDCYRKMRHSAVIPPQELQ